MRQFMLICLGVVCLGACNMQTQESPKRGVIDPRKYGRTPLRPRTPLEKSIDRLSREIADLEQSYPPVSALWPENAGENKPPPSAQMNWKRDPNNPDQVLIQKDQLAAVFLYMKAAEDRMEYELSFNEIDMQILRKSDLLSDLLVERRKEEEGRYSSRH